MAGSALASCFGEPRGSGDGTSLTACAPNTKQRRVGGSIDSGGNGTKTEGRFSSGGADKGGGHVL
jgi:hypothetical protein